MNLFDQWVTRSWLHDARHVSRWALVTMSHVRHDGAKTVLLRRVLGWDASPWPSWVTPVQVGSVEVDVSYHEEASATLDRLLAREAISRCSEIRRIVPEVQSWTEELPASLHWGLGLPCIMYECWGTPEQRSTAATSWKTLPERDAQMLQDTGLIPQELGYLGTTIIHLPQLRPFFLGIHHVVLPGGEKPWGKLRLASEVLDGRTRLSLNVTALIPDRSITPDEEPGFSFVSLWFVDSTFAAMNAVTPMVESKQSPNAIARLPEDAHGHSGSDWKLTLFGSEGEHIDSTEIGLIRGIGGGYFTSEPWKESAPHLGFSAPASITYLPPGEKTSPAVAHELIARVGSPALLCDPYLRAESLERVLAKVKVQKALANRPRVEKPKEMEDARQLIDLCRRSQTELRFVGKQDQGGGLHDRFIIGPRSAYLLGTSLNSIGKNHSFLIATDNRIRLTLTRVFESLWTNAREL